MIIEEQIRAFIANKLSPDEEQEFLISLAADEKRSAALKTEMTLLAGVAADTQSVDVSRSVEASLFAGLGLNILPGKNPVGNTPHTASMLRIGLRALLFVGAGFIGGYGLNEYMRHNDAPASHISYESKQEQNIITPPLSPTVDEKNVVIEKPLGKVTSLAVKEQTALSVDKPASPTNSINSTNPINDSNTLPPVQVNVKVRKPTKEDPPSTPR